MPLGAARFGLLGGVEDLGKLELIETQTVSSVTYVDFNSIQESTYNVHFLTANDVHCTVDSRRFTVQLFESGVINTTDYAYAFQAGTVAGTFNERKSGSTGSLRFSATYGNATNETGQGYMYLYNLGDISRYSFITAHSFGIDTSGNGVMEFGSGFLENTTEVDGIRVQLSGDFASATFSLYGIAES